MKRGSRREDVSAGGRDHEAEGRGLRSGRISDKHNSARTADCGLAEKQFLHVDNLQGDKGVDGDERGRQYKVLRRK